MKTKSGNMVYGVNYESVVAGDAWCITTSLGKYSHSGRDAIGAFRLTPEMLIEDREYTEPGDFPDRVHVIVARRGSESMVPNVPRGRVQAVIEAMISGENPLAVRDAA